MLHFDSCLPRNWMRFYEDASGEWTLTVMAVPWDRGYNLTSYSQFVFNLDVVNTHLYSIPSISLMVILSNLSCQQSQIKNSTIDRSKSCGFCTSNSGATHPCCS